MDNQKLPKGEWTKDTNLMKLEKSGLKFGLSSNGDVAIFLETGKQTVDFYLRKNRWKCRGAKKTTHGTIEQFIDWYRAFRGVM